MVLFRGLLGPFVTPAKHSHSELHAWNAKKMIDCYANNIMASDGPLIFIIFIFKLIHLNGLKWTKFITVNYTDEPAVCNQEGILASIRTRAHSGVKLG